MMKMTKTLEIRDAATLIPMLAIRLDSSNMTEVAINLASHSGFKVRDRGYLYLISLVDNTLFDYKNIHSQPRFKAAYDHILKEWDSIIDGDVIDIEYLLNESDSIKESEVNPPSTKIFRVGELPTTLESGSLLKVDIIYTIDAIPDQIKFTSYVRREGQELEPSDDIMDKILGILKSELKDVCPSEPTILDVNTTVI